MARPNTIKEPARQYSFLIPDRVRDTLRMEAYRRRGTVPELIRAAIDQWLERELKK